MEFRSTIYAIIIVSLLIMATGTIVVNWTGAYNSNADYNLYNFSKNSELSGYAGNFTGKVTPQSSETSADFETGTYRGVYAIVTGIFKPFRLVFGQGGMVDAIGERLHLPDYVTLTFVNIFIFGVIFTIAAIIFRQIRQAV